MPRKWLATWLLTATLVASAFSQSRSAALPEGGIIGTISTENGGPGEGARPCISTQSENTTSIHCLSPADKDGRFTIEHLKPGKYKLFAVNEAEGYSTHTQLPGQDVEITAEHPWVNASVRLSVGGGVLLVTVTDRPSGKTIPKAWIHYTLIDGGGAGSTNVSKERTDFAVPVDSDLLVTVTAEGYKGWIYTNGCSSTRPVMRVVRGERRELNIELEPLADSANPNRER